MKRIDIKSSVLQEILLSVSSAIVNTMEALLESKEKKALPNYKALLSTLTDSIALLGHVHKEMSFNHRDALRYHLNPEFRQACSRVVKPTGFLFGDDLSKTIQDIRATNKVVNTVSTGTPSNRESSRFKNHQVYQTTARKPFLWQKGRGTYIPSPEQFPPRVSSTTSILSPSQKEIYEQLVFLKSQPQVTSFSDFIEGPFKVYNMSRVSVFQGGNCPLITLNAPNVRQIHLYLKLF